ncbi:MAG: hypothetical protein FWF46_04740 [Oscillospiraceae bacterium]|nr:hypothetical protein [Oscillospiraceae bacterium]
MKKPLPYIRLGIGRRPVMYNASHHSLEWITTPVIMKFVENFAKAKVTTGFLQGYDINWLFRNTSLYIVPMVNPDGVDLVLDQMPYNSPYYLNAIKINNTGHPLSQVWNANIRGVDLFNLQPQVLKN